MNVLVIYDSAYGNTKKIATTIADTIDKPHSVKLLAVSEVLPPDLQPIDLLVAGSPTQAGRPTKGLQDYLNNFSPNSLVGVQVAAFDTRYAIAEHGVGPRILMKTIGFAAPRIAAILEKKGGDLVVKPEGFIVTGKEGPLKQGELERSSAWIKSIIKSSAAR